jgi:hypothetical protein
MCVMCKNEADLLGPHMPCALCDKDMGVFWLHELADPAPHAPGRMLLVCAMCYFAIRGGKE